MRMEEKVPESAYLSYDREKLLNTIARFDDGIRVEDVVGPENESDNLKQYSNTVLIQVLLEFICHAFVKDENNREKLLMETCKRLSKFKILNDLLIMDKNNALRMTMKYKVINFLKQVCKEVIPAAELDAGTVQLFQNDCLFTDLKLYYCVNFIELDQIGKGGFGSVYKVQYKLNRLIYAVKKIPFIYKTDGNFLMVMREANNFAALSHPNIVRYYSAWIEMSESDPISKPSAADCSFAPDFEDKDSNVEYNGLVIKPKSPSGNPDNLSANHFEKNSYNKSSESVESDFIVFSESAKITKDVSWSVGINSQNSNNMDEDMKNYFCNADNDSDDDDDDSNEDFLLSNFKIQGVLYIQMEYCDSDLRFWLDKRAQTRGKDLPFEMDVNEIFSNIVKGVAHIHSRNIIHRDLKPHNIFYSRSCNAVKIGDFGLATLAGFTDSFNSKSHNHSSSVGTPPYAAPEQRKSKMYDMKVDIYSLGVILIELINVCTTRAELSHIIEAMKNSKTIEGSKTFPVLGNLASVLISDDPEKRMPAKEIVNFIDKDAKMILKEVVMNEFKTVMEEKDETIRSLNETVQHMQATILKQNTEISRLNKIFSKLNIQSE